VPFPCLGIPLWESTFDLVAMLLAPVLLWGAIWLAWRNGGASEPGAPGGLPSGRSPEG
jgi:hypothetical protein